MEQRLPRLGDLVDDYCPRERRVTNHAIVAIVEDSIRQTRCTTCEAEHVFKGGKPPRRRTRAANGSAETDVVDNTGGQLVTPAIEEAAPAAMRAAAPEQEPEPVSPSADAARDDEPAPERDDDPHGMAWPANRQLIRATLPRTEGEPPPPRPIPEFTMHRYNARGAGNGFRGRGWSGNGHGNGNGNGNANGNTFGSGGRGERRGQGPGFGGGQGQGHGRRRHRKRPR